MCIYNPLLAYTLLDVTSYHRLFSNIEILCLCIGTIPEKPPVKLNPTLKLQDPFHLDTFIKNNREEIDTKGFIKLFQRDDFAHQFQVEESYYLF